MKKYRLALQAEQDLLDIFLIGLDRWGIKQAEKYAEELHNCFNTLADHPELGVKRPELRENPRSFLKGSHIIFYRVADKIIEISTISHQSMDYTAQLKKPT